VPWSVAWQEKSAPKNSEKYGWQSARWFKVGPEKLPLSEVPALRNQDQFVSGFGARKPEIKNKKAATQMQESATLKAGQ